MKVSVKTPATIANLGCGFDSFGLALPLYNIITVEETVLPGSGIEINIINEKNNEDNDLADVSTDKNNIVKLANELLEDKDEYARMSTAKNPYGDGLASQRITDSILYSFDKTNEKPTEFKI